jgi:hypothetical protein
MNDWLNQLVCLVIQVLDNKHSKLLLMPETAG